MSEERRLVDAMLSVTQVEKEALLRKGEIVTAAERSVTTVRQTIVDGVESRKAIAGQAPPPLLPSHYEYTPAASKWAFHRKLLIIPIHSGPPCTTTFMVCFQLNFKPMMNPPPPPSDPPTLLDAAKASLNSCSS
jgi:hypothetical protein